MELERYSELLNILRRWRDIFAENIRLQIENNPNLDTRVRDLYNAEGVGENFGSWLERFCRQLAIQFILKTLFIRVLEDRGLLKPYRIRTRDSQQLFQALTSYLGTTAYLRFVFRDIAYILPDLFAETNQDIIWPDDSLSEQFIEDVWRRADVDRDGWLRYDFRGEDSKGFDSRFIGDIYQDIDEEAREHYALLQTPHFISQFILDHTLEKRFEEKDFREITLIDPTCGSGHFLVDAFKRFVDRYTEVGEYVDSPEGKAKLACNIIERHLFGADLNPYACALSRFRLMLAACDFAHPIDLEAFREQHFNIVHCDSLIPYNKLIGMDEELGPQLNYIFGGLKERILAFDITTSRYDVVVGNPPYIMPTDSVKRELYRNWYISAYMKFGLAAPFIERFINLANEQGRIGLISSNGFARRDFGKKLIENVLPNYNLNSIIDLSGAYIPGHGTPTLILFLINSPPNNDYTKLVSCLKGETQIPQTPSKGIVWNQILDSYSNGVPSQNEFVEFSFRKRSELSKHPWNLEPKRGIKFAMDKKGKRRLKEFTDYLGPGCLTGEDELYINTLDQARRLKIPRKFTMPVVRGEDIRDWMANPHSLMIVPYEKTGDEWKVSNIKNTSLFAYLYPFINRLRKRSTLSKNKEWYELSRTAGFRKYGELSIGFAFIGTHNHFVLNQGDFIYQRSGYSMWISEPNDYEDYLLITALINSCAICYYLKKICFNKKPGHDPIRDNWEYSGTNVGKLPIPIDLTADKIKLRHFINISFEINQLVKESSSPSFIKGFDSLQEDFNTHESLKVQTNHSPIKLIPFNNAKDLIKNKNDIERTRNDNKQRLIFLQEEIDWFVYEMYGLLPHAPLAEDYLSQEEYELAALELGQRAFEQAGKGYKGDWPETWHDGPEDHLPGPAAHLPQLSENMQRLIKDRLDIIQSNEDIAILEDPLYKRRWSPPDYDKEFREALEWWVREMAEWELEQAGQTLHIREWSRRLMQHERIRAALEVYTGTPNYDPTDVIERIILSEAVPNRPEYYLAPSGLRKLSRGEQEFKSSDFSKSAVWKVRGKRNIPRERYITYTDFEPGWYGWAGWNAEQRAEALVRLIEEANRKGLSILHQQCGLRASLRDVLSQLEHIPQSEQQEFKDIAYMCGIQEPCFCQAFRETEVSQRPPG